MIGTIFIDTSENAASYRSFKLFCLPSYIILIDCRLLLRLVKYYIILFESCLTIFVIRMLMLKLNFCFL